MTFEYKVALVNDPAVFVTKQFNVVSYHCTYSLDQDTSQTLEYSTTGPEQEAIKITMTHNQDCPTQLKTHNLGTLVFSTTSGDE